MIFRKLPTFIFCQRIHSIPSSDYRVILPGPIVIGIQTMHQVQLLAVLQRKTTAKEIVCMDACPDGSDKHCHQEKQEDMS